MSKRIIQILWEKLSTNSNRDLSKEIRKNLGRWNYDVTSDQLERKIYFANSDNCHYVHDIKYIEIKLQKNKNKSTL